MATKPVSLLADALNCTGDPSGVPPLTLGRKTPAASLSLHGRCPPPDLSAHPLPIFLLQSSPYSPRRVLWGCVGGGRVTFLNGHFSASLWGGGLAPTAETYHPYRILAILCSPANLALPKTCSTNTGLTDVYLIHMESALWPNSSGKS